MQLYNERMEPLQVKDLIAEIHADNSEDESYLPDQSGDEDFVASSEDENDLDESDEDFVPSTEEETEEPDGETSESHTDLSKEESEPGSDSEEKKFGYKSNTDLTMKDLTSKKKKQRKRKSNTGRERKQCPVEFCLSEVVHLPRHLHDVHKWSKERARTALSRYGKRKKYTFTDQGKAPKKRKNTESTSKCKDYHHYCSCPVEGCMSLVKRIIPHLRKFHGLKPGTKGYAIAYLNARPCATVSNTAASQKRPIVSGPEVTVIDDNGDECKVEKVIVNDEEVKDDEASSTPRVIIQFEAWLRSADGGNLDEITCKQHRAQLTNILRVVDNLAIECLFDEKKINENFIEDFAKKKYHPKTIKSYLMSLRHFYCFCTTPASENLRVQITGKRLLYLKEKVKRWYSSLSKECSKRHWKKMEDDLHALISPEQFKEFEKSTAARSAVCLLGQLSGAHSIEITPNQYTLIRDFLLVEISIDNANRAGALANMNLEDLNKATKLGDESVVLVRKHKTVATHGPARIIFSSKLYSWITIFVREVRSKVARQTKSPSERVFISSSGEALVSSQINKAIKSVWKKAGMTGSLSSTIIRKSAVSKIHTSHSNEDQGNLADLMAHNLGTARKFYRLQEKSKSSVKASQNLRMVMRGQEENSPGSGFEEGASKDASLPSEEETLQQRVSRSLTVDNDGDKSVIPPTFATSNLRGVFSDQDLEHLSDMFVGMIKSGSPVSRQVIKESLEKERWGSELLKRVPFDTIVNRIKYERRRSRSKS